MKTIKIGRKGRKLRENQRKSTEADPPGGQRIPKLALDVREKITDGAWSARNIVKHEENGAGDAKKLVKHEENGAWSAKKLVKHKEMEPGAPKSS